MNTRTVTPRRYRPDSESNLIGLAIGGFGPIAVAGALVPLRTEIASTNLALILVVVVVIAAVVGGRAAGALAAVLATLSFDFFLTRPYLSLRIAKADDLETALILLAVGLLVGQVAVRARESRHEREVAVRALSRVRRVADQMAKGVSLEDVVLAVIAELRSLLVLRECRLEFPPFDWPPLARLERSGTVESSEHRWFGRGFALPDGEIELPVLGRGQHVARLVIEPEPDVALTLEERIVAVALADQLGAALVLAAPDERTRIENEVSQRG
jgi:hypothetical protein